MVYYLPKRRKQHKKIEQNMVRNEGRSHIVKGLGVV